MIDGPLAITHLVRTKWTPTPTQGSRDKTLIRLTLNTQCVVLYSPPPLSYAKVEMESSGGGENGNKVKCVRVVIESY